MNYIFSLNDDLTRSFSKRYNAEDDHIIEYDYIKFNGGEPHIKIKDPSRYDKATQVLFVTKIKNGDDLLKLAAAADAIDKLATGCDMFLHIGYMPGGRQDRVCVPGEAFTASVYASLIESMTDWAGIQVLDPHSDVTCALLDAQPIDNLKFVETALEAIDLTTGCLVSPDAGANKKVHTLLKHLNAKHNFDMVRADKLRDLETGKIIETVVYGEEFKNAECVIVDDICDGGRTFIELAKVLKAKGAKSVTLIVTHGIFANGMEKIYEYVDQVVTTNTFIDMTEDDGDRLTVIGIDETYYNFKE